MVLRLQFRILIGVFLLSIVLVNGCGDGGLFDPDLPYPGDIAPIEGLTALQFPTSNSVAWTYQEVDTEAIHTLTVEGLRYERGRTLRQLTNSNLETPTDFYAANAWYLRIDGYFFRRFGFPISATYFEKSTDAYVEVAFDAFLPGFDPPTFHQQHFPARRLWVFPLTPESSWTVFETIVPPIVTATRTVVADKQTVRTPQATYTDAYLVEESFEVEGETVENPVARYWVAPDVGVVKYEYKVLDGGHQTFELLRFVN